MAPKQPRPTQSQRRAKTVDAVVRAAIDVIAERGYIGATLQQIAARAGVSKGGVHHHFRSKDDVAPAVVARCLVEIETLLAPALTSDAPVPERLRRTLRALDALRRERSPAMATLTDLAIVSRNDPKLALRVAPVVRERLLATSTTFEALLASGGLRARVAPAAIVRALVDLLVGDAVSRKLAAEDGVEWLATAEATLFALVGV